MKKIIMFVMVLVIGLTAGIANAALLASESFEYTADENLAGQDGGTGWAGAWTADEYLVNNAAKIGTGSLEPPVVVGTAGNHVEVVIDSEEAESWNQRDLTTPLLDDGSTYWVSVLFQKTNSDNDSSWSGFAVGENLWFGKGYDLDNLILWDNTGGDMETDVPATDLSWLVLKIETNPVAEEQVYLWVNPDAGNEPSIITANANLEVPLLGGETPGGADFFILEAGGAAANSGDFTCDEIRIGTSFDDVFIEVGPKNPILIDPNVMTVYETDETEGDFTVALKFPPVGQGSPGNPAGTPISVEIIVDPNGFGGGSADITLLDGSGPNNRVTFTKNAGNWSVPEVIRFKANDDSIAEPPTLFEVQNIAVWAVPTPHEPNLAQPVAQKIVMPSVWDNDQANILFTITPTYTTGAPGEGVPVTGPVLLLEEPKDFFGFSQTRYRDIGVTLQVQPTGDDVRISVANESDYPPIMDPPLTIASDPNALIFTDANWNVSQTITISANDDDVLQVLGEEGEYPSADGDQNYQAQIVFTITDDGGDTRFTDLERTVDINIQDNECGAFGILTMDIGNSDPCAIDEDGNPLPDCYVNIYDVIEIATQWLDCSYIQDPSCESYL
ncbi:MAG: hypothetical protein ACYSWP_14735 [Planctomycetota bacterium]|jgi:hypothetical protein